MEFTTVLFYVFAALLVISALRVITAPNPVQSALFLVLAFFNAAALWMLLQAEFLAILLVLVYVGAVMVLFLFVVMMLDVDFAQLRQGFLQYLPVGLLVGLIVLVELVLVVFTWSIGPSIQQSVAAPIPPLANMPNTEALGHVLYTRYIYFFQAAGMVLLVAMIGAIVLTLHHKPGVKRQNIARQNARSKAASIEIVKVLPGQGL
jgi:NADH-quinone oxidoreductase subunit J